MSPLALFWVLAQPAAAHQGHTSTLAWDACGTHTLGEVCEFETETHELHIGTCRSMSGDLICVRNRPIVAARTPIGPGTQTAAGLAALGALGMIGGLVLPALAGRFSFRPDPHTPQERS